MTLQEYVNQGNPMLSNHTSAWCCQVAKIREKDLRQMQLEDIYLIPQAGEVAKREVLRWRQMNILYDSARNSQ
jgi:hypothetical protein